MIRVIRFGPAVSALIAVWLLSACNLPNGQNKVAPAPGQVVTRDLVCPSAPYGHDLANEKYQAIPPPVANEQIDDVLLPGGNAVGCQNPRFRLVFADDVDPDPDIAARKLFDRLTQNGVGWKHWPVTGGKRYGGENFLANDKNDGIREHITGNPPDHLVVGWRKRVGCRRALVWIFQWPSESGEDGHPAATHQKPVLLEFVNRANPNECVPAFRDGDGGGP